jgi:hypothetical protein
MGMGALAAGENTWRTEARALNSECGSRFSDPNWTDGIRKEKEKSGKITDITGDNIDHITDTEFRGRTNEIPLRIQV